MSCQDLKVKVVIWIMDTLSAEQPHKSLKFTFDKTFNFQGQRKVRSMDWPLLLIIGNSNVKIKFAMVTLKCSRSTECATIAHELQLTL